MTTEEIDAALSKMPVRQREPIVRIRTVFLAVFMTGLFCGLIIADPLARLIEVTG